MKKSLEKNLNNCTQEIETVSAPQNGNGVSKAYLSAMKAFAATNKRLHPELYKGNSKLGKVRS
jgi:hypothetical protein